ncbi:hypothetical protein NVP1262O_59 [Vibrio phage 1.262.O._10N.286.51.A9]|nr:hypothetical protein NVP1262O_59 [Vibrio phage 1.262.O._10N.286.51.A9]
MPIAIVRNPEDTICSFKVTIVNKIDNLMTECKTHNYSVQDVIQEITDALPDNYFVYEIVNLETNSTYDRKEIAELL